MEIIVMSPAVKRFQSLLIYLEISKGDLALHQRIYIAFSQQKYGLIIFQGRASRSAMKSNEYTLICHPFRWQFAVNARVLY